MSISVSSLAQSATQMKAQDIQLELSSAIMKQIKDQKEVEGQLLLKLMSPPPSLDGTGKMVDIQA